MTSMQWKILAQEDVYQNERGIILEKQKVLLPNGTILPDYYQIKMRNFVTMIIQDVKGDFLCIVQYKHGIGKVGLTLPGGIIDDDETPLETAARELREETGYACAELTHRGRFVLSGNQHICFSHIISGQGARKVAEATQPDQENGRLCFISKSDVKQALQTNGFPIISHALAVAMILVD